MAKKQTGCLEVLVGLGVLWALPGVILDECSRAEPSGAILVAPVGVSVDRSRAGMVRGRDRDRVRKREAEVRDRVREYDAEVRREHDAEVRDRVGEHDAEVRRRFLDSAPWARSQNYSH